MPASVVTRPPAVARSAPSPATTPLLPLAGADLRVPLVTGGTVRYANLDHAASTPALAAVADHVASVLPHYASVHRGAGFASQVSTALYEAARATVARFVGARPDDVVVVTRNTTDALNLLAAAVPGDGDVVHLDLEHHANLLPWRHRRTVPAAPTLDETLHRLDAALRRDRAALVAVTGASNVTGEVLPVAEVARIAHRHGARIAVDGAQLVPHRRVDVAAWDVDYLACSGHKLYAPFGAGVLVGRRDWLDAAPPHLAGGGAVREVDLAAGTRWAAAPERHEGGTPNVVGAAALAEACRTLGALPDGALERHEHALLTRLTAGLDALPGVRRLSLWPDGGDRVGVVSFTVEGHDPGRVAAYLSAEHGIGVRDGRFCAHPLLARLGNGAGALRASIGAGSGSADVDRLLAALGQLLERGPRWSYALDRGRWAPSPDPRPLPFDLEAVTTTASPCAVG